MDIAIADKDLKYLSGPARVALEKAARAYMKDLISEAGRLESNERDHLGPPEITQTNIQDAVLLFRKYPSRRKPSWGFTSLQIVAVVTALLTGAIAPDSPTKMQDFGAVVLFIIILAVALVTSTIQIIVGRTR